MKYEIEAMPVGVFSSRLELHWFCFLRQHSERVKYVGHVERWRDFVFKDQSIEIKPFFTEEVLNEVAERSPQNCVLFLACGDPDSPEIYKVVKENGDVDAKKIDGAIEWNFMRQQTFSQ